MTISSRVGRSLRFVDWLSGWTTGAAQASIQVTGRAKHTQVLLTAGNAPTNITLNTASLKLLSFADCLRVASPLDAAEPYVSVKMTVTANTQAGIVINLDSYSNPQACIHIWCDRVDGKIYARPMAAGAWGADTLAGVAFTYSAGALLEVRRIGDVIYVFYNGSYIGTWTTAVPSTNTKVAFFLTDAASYIESVTSFPTGSLDHSAYAIS